MGATPPPSIFDVVIRKFSIFGEIRAIFGNFLRKVANEKKDCNRNAIKLHGKNAGFWGNFVYTRRHWKF